MNEFVGCYWCRNRHKFTCKLHNYVKLDKTLAQLRRTIKEENLQYEMNEAEVDSWEFVNKFIGEDCRGFNKSMGFVFR